jgi:hypothetical protein
MKAMNFQIDGGKQYAGFSEGEYWNGWACPFFTLEVAHEIAKDVSAEFPNALVYDEEDDSFVSRDDAYPKEEWERFKGVVKDGVKLYPVGSWSWIWDEVE